MAQSSRIERVNEEIRVALASIISQSKDPRLEGCMVTVSGVRTAPDLSYSKVWISVYGTEREKAEVFAALEHAKGFIRTSLAHTIVLRIVPQLTFIEDTSFSYADKINKLLKKVLPDEPSQEEDKE